ncbi:MAG: outer membrane protein assembly factor BamB [Methylococcales bacterium]|nr:outer membrane protein assembly factor BamB [Methylococcales bacterium]
MQKRQYFRLLFSGLTLSLLASCTILEATNDIASGVTDYFSGGEDNKEPPAPLVDYKPELTIKERWSEHASEGEGDESFLSLVIGASDENILIADIEGLIQVRKMNTGDLVWEKETRYAFSAGPGIHGNTAILATSNAEIIAVNLTTGRRKWHTTVSSEVLAKPIVLDKSVIIRTSDGKVIALDKWTGSQLWVFEKNVPALSIRGTGTPLVINDNIIAGYANGKLLELRLSDGKTGWETSIDIPRGRSEVERLVDLDVDPIVADGVIFISSYQGGTSAVIAMDGDVLWRNEDVSSNTGISHDWRYLYVSDTKDQVWQLDQRTGASLWKQDALKHRTLTAPVAYEDYVIVGDYEGYIHWLSVNDGRQLARIRVSDSPIESKPVVIDKVVYVYAKDGTLAALEAKLF